MSKGRFDVAKDEVLSAVLDVAGVLVIVLDTEGRVVRFNKACERVTGWTFEEVKGRSVWELFISQDEIDSVKRVFRELRAGEFPNEFENDWITKGGEPRRIMWSNTALVGEGGRVCQVIGTGIDVTDRRKAEDELLKHQRHLKELVEERTAELVAANRQLGQEIKIRRKTEDDLRNALLEVARLKDRLEAENVYLQEEIKSSHDFEEIVGESAALKGVLLKVQQVASTDASVLITGETGTGKELLARAIHSRSTRRDRPLVRVNCSALPGALIENELFGHEKGAFTGALTKKVGRFELADGGTVFLDEIGDLSPDIQVKLLRVLQEGEFERIGSTKTIKVDVRVIAATHSDLAQAVAEGRFRSDLYYRLNVFPIHVPPLRERVEDIPLLVSHIIRNKRATIGKTIEEVPREVLDALSAYHWPGNIRELENVVAHSAILSSGSRLELCDVFDGGQDRSAPAGAGGGARPVGEATRQMRAEAAAQVRRHTHDPLVHPGAQAHAGGQVHDPVAYRGAHAGGLKARVGAWGTAGPSAGGKPQAIGPASEPRTLKEMESAYILSVVERCRWRISGAGNAADLLGMNASTLRSRMKKLGIRRPADGRRTRGGIR